MNKLSYNRTLAWILLVVAVAAAAAWGQYKKPAALPQVSYGVWICDDAGLLSDATEKTVADYNKSWNSQYSALVAVATVDNIKGWSAQDFADTLGNAWGLGSNDMLLLLYPNGNSVEYWVSNGETLRQLQMDSQEWDLKVAIENVLYDGGADAGVVAFFRQTDVYYAQVLGSRSWDSDPYGDSAGWHDRSGGSVFSVLLLIVGIFAVWALLDRVRYSRYRRRTVAVGAPRVTYYPIFWGRRAAPPPPPRCTPPVHAGGHYQPPRPTPPPPRRNSGSYRSAPPANRSIRPGGGNNRGGFGGGGFGGGKRG